MIPLRDNIPSRGIPFVTYFLIGANILGFLFEMALAGVEGVDNEQVQRAFQAVGSESATAQIVHRVKAPENIAAP